MEEQTENLLQFPCDFSIKAMGKAEPDFDLLVYELVRRHAPEIHEGAVRSRTSKGGKWVSITITLRAQSRKQLDAIYMDLSAHEKIVMAL